MSKISTMHHAQHREIAKLYVEGKKQTEIARELGVTDATVYAVTRNPAFQDVLEAELARRLSYDLRPLASRVVEKLLRDDSVSPRVRADLAARILTIRSSSDMIGSLRTRNGNAPRLVEMSRDQLAAFIHQAEGELAARARDVTPGAADETQDTQGLDAQALDLL